MCNKNTQHGSRCTTTIPTIGRFLVVFTLVSYCFSPAECCLRGVDPVRYLSTSNGELSNGGNLPSAVHWDSYLLGNALRSLEDGEESSGFPWQLVLLQLACCAVIIGVSLFGIFLPKIFLRLSRKENGFFRRHARMVESCCNGFAAGAFWGLTLFHVLFEATDILSHNDIGFHVGINFYNMVYMLSFLGYLFILVVDRLLQVVAAKTAEKFADSNGVTMLPGGGSGTAKARADTLKSLETILTGLDNRSAIVQGVCTTIALAIHSFFEGMVIGMRDEYTIIVIMTVSVIGHKWAAAFALSQKLISYNVPRKAKIAMLTIFISSSPLGIIVGMPLAAASDVIVGVFDALTVGILIYVASDTTRDVFRSTNWEALLARTRKAKSMTQARDVPLSASKTTTTTPITNSSGVRGDQYLEMMSHQHDHSSHKHCDSKVDSEECCAECCLTTQDTAEEDISSLMVSLVETTKSLKDPLVASYSALFFRVLFICAGAALIFGMMFVHLSSEDEHPPCIVSM